MAGYDRFNPFDEHRVHYLQFDLFLLGTEAGNGRLYSHISQKTLGPTRWNETSSRTEAKTTVESRKSVLGCHQSKVRDGLFKLHPDTAPVVKLTLWSSSTSLPSQSLKTFEKWRFHPDYLLESTTNFLPFQVLSITKASALCLWNYTLPGLR